MGVGRDCWKFLYYFWGGVYCYIFFLLILILNFIHIFFILLNTYLLSFFLSLEDCLFPYVLLSFLFGLYSFISIIFPSSLFILVLFFIYILLSTNYFFLSTLSARVLEYANYSSQEVELPQRGHRLTSGGHPKSQWVSNPWLGNWSGQVNYNTNF